MSSLLGQTQLSHVLDGIREKGKDIRTQNVTACVAVANIVKSSLGPTGLDKMLVDEIGDVTITNDGATILSKLEVQHPAAKVLVDLAGLQDKEVGDGTTSVVVLAAELLKVGNQLVRSKIHPTAIISGYRVAMREACNFVKSHLAVPVDSLGREAILQAAKTSMSSKIIGGLDMDFFANLVVDAITRVGAPNSKGKMRYPIKAVNVLMAPGDSSSHSRFIEGFALNCTVASQEMPKQVRKAKIALLDFNLNRSKVPHGVVIKTSKAKDITEMNQHEVDLLKELVGKIIDSGANVVLTSRGIDDIACKYLVEAGVMGVRRVKREDLLRIAKATGGSVLLNLANLDGEEEFDPSFLGKADLVTQETIAQEELILIKGTATAATSSIILRGANSMMLEEMERSVHDALCATKRVLESRLVVPGGGAVEAALSVHLENFALSLGTRAQLPVVEFARALLCIPKILAVNSALDAADLTAKLCTLHYAAQNSEDDSKAKYSRYGLDLDVGTVRDNVEAGVLEPSISKLKSIRFATEAAITILRIDEMIKLNPKPEPAHPHDH
eukprot:TRINITY_DN11737_c0_g1_i1.p1 TRINITY_DN11737_c0_g1~~TRINITY_DN11737_c0_g1_i1.p1  ORF type:complete len:556 (-),score=154.19 TRINITY_DN11737_c0_g1_i1:39-1706(-)